MSEVASWNPASGCFQCPINVDLKQSWADTNPLACFSDIGRGYFSAPLYAMYIPLLFSESDYFPAERGYPGGDSRVGEVDNAHVDKFLAIATHENSHILTSMFPVKGLIHLVTDRASQALFDIISGSNNNAWEDLQDNNIWIAKLVKSIALVEELIVTLLGCAEFRAMSSEQSHKVKADSIEKVFVDAHSQLFGPDFEKMYGQLDAIYRKFGSEPLKTLTYYSMDWLEAGYSGTSEEVSLEESNEETTMLRLYRCLDIFNNVRNLPEARNWTKDDWDGFFADWLVDFRRWQGGRQDLDRLLGNNLSQSQEWWNDRGFKGADNPALAREWIHKVPKEMELWVVGEESVNITPEEIISTMLTMDNPPKDIADPRYLQRLQRVNEHIRRASDQNRTVILMGTGPNSTGIVFVPLFDKSNQRAIPFASHMTGVKPSFTTEEVIKYDLTARAFLSTLLFFEGLRLMVVFGCGVRCPVRSMEWPQRALSRMEGDKLSPCCGRNKELIAFWEAGHKAKEKGWFQPHTWEWPRECI